MPRKKTTEKNESSSNIEEKVSTKKSSRKTITEAEKIKKRKVHEEKIAKKQESRLLTHIERVKRKESKGPALNKERFYVTNAKLLEQLLIWRDSGKVLKKGQWLDELGRISEFDQDGKTIIHISEEDNREIPIELGKMVTMIAERLTNHSNFKNYPFDFKQDMVSYAKFKVFQGLHNYNFEFKNAFAYITTACYNAFVSMISKYYKEKNFKREYLKKAIIKLESTMDINSSKILNQFMKGYLQDEFGESSIDGKEGDSI